MKKKNNGYTQKNFYKVSHYGGISLIVFAISRKCVRYEERAWKPCERREKERKV